MGRPRAVFHVGQVIFRCYGLIRNRHRRLPLNVSIEAEWRIDMADRMTHPGADGKSSVGRFATSRRQMVMSSAAAVGGLVLGVGVPTRAWAAEEGVSHAAEAIHQEPVFKASRKQVYAILTQADLFEKVVELSAAMKTIGTVTKPAEISSEAGGVFSLFNGYITGRHVELVPNELLVQAWRPESWKPGEYSIVSFRLVEEAANTRIVFDHRGFPDGLGEHLWEGWKGNYWGPMEKVLATQK
jgi:activator of HSP90 ATPase